MKYHDGLILKRNVDSHGNPISINILDVKQVMDSHSCIVLTQLPNEYYGVNIQGYNEVYDVDKLGALDYKVDYANGIVYFNPVNIGKSAADIHSWERDPELKAFLKSLVK